MIGVIGGVVFLLVTAIILVIGSGDYGPRIR